MLSDNLQEIRKKVYTLKGTFFNFLVWTKKEPGNGTFIEQEILKILILTIYSQLSRSNTARGSCTGFVTVGPTKVLG